MIRSLNQIETTARKAVRGAGLPWGIADDAGRAVRWLHQHGVDGVTALAAALDDHAADAAPTSLAGVWRARGGVLDALLTGASAADCIRRPRIDTAAVAHPLLVAGFVGAAVAAAADRAGAADPVVAVSVTWQSARLTCRADGLWIDAAAAATCAGPRSGITATVADRLTCRHTDAATGTQHPPLINECAVTADGYAKLERHAARTLVPATAASRAGAGARDD